jgi:hypothetical protein
MSGKRDSGAHLSKVESEEKGATFEESGAETSRNQAETSVAPKG